MRVLLPIREKDDLGAIGEYIARRFKQNEVDVDVVTVLGGADSNGRGSQDRGARAALNTVAHALRNIWEVRSVRTHLEHGDPVEAIVGLSQDCRSDLILLPVPVTNGLAKILFNRITRRLFKKTTCSVELLRPDLGLPTGCFNVAIPLLLEDAVNFPYERLQELAWVNGTQIKILAVVEPVIDESLLEVSPTTILRAQNLAARRKSRAEGKLSGICLEVTEMLGDDVDVDFEIVEGQLMSVAEAAAREGESTLLVIGSDIGGPTPGGGGKAPVCASIARSTDCSVLYFYVSRPRYSVAESPYSRIVSITRA